MPQDIPGQEETEVALSPPAEGASVLGHGTAGICLSGRLNIASFKEGWNPVILEDSPRRCSDITTQKDAW